jgi:ferredoxin-NADP reductase
MYKYEVTEVKMISSNAVLITLKPEDRMRQLRHEAGQYAAISFTINGRPSTVRCFSVVTSASEKGVLQFAMRLTGRFTKTAAGLQPGDEVTVQGPYGDFTLENGTSQNAIFFAGGIGVTPFISMLRDVTRRSRDMGLTLVYSCQTQDDIPFGAELAELERNNPNVTVIYVIARGEVDNLAAKKVIRGILTAEGIDQIMRGNYAPYDYYICGPTGYMKAIKKALLAKQVDPESVYSEEFGVKTRGLPSLRSSLTGRVYAGTAAGLVLAVLMVTGIDLKSTIAKATVATPITSPASTPTTSSTDNSTATYSTNNDSTSTTTPTTTTTPSTTTQQQSTYQQPVSTVS